MGTILIVDDDIQLVTAFAHLLGSRGHFVISAASVEDCLRILARETPELIILDVNLGKGSGLDAFRQIKELQYSAPVIVMTGERTMQNAVEAMALGAYSYQLKPFDADEMLQTIERGLEDARPQPKVVSRRESPKQELVGGSIVMQDVYKAIGRVAPTDTTVLIRGESGSGKELVARVIHKFSRHRDGPFVAVNCLAIPETLLESELFGHEKGAFTGADARRVGRFEQASGGTLFLDEIGDIPASVQGKILRVLQERVFTRVGGEQVIRADARVLSATNRDLEASVRDGTFRTDLLFRLNVVTIMVPSLRDRPVDIPALVEQFLSSSAAELLIPVPAVTPGAMNILASYHWPGNVRELQHCLSRALVFHPGAMLHEDHIHAALGLNQKDINFTSAADKQQLQEVVHHYLRSRGGGLHFDSLMEEVETILLSEALRLTDGNQSRAAKLLGLPRQTFRSKLNHSADPRLLAIGGETGISIG